jgi:hypothetical protein
MHVEAQQTDRALLPDTIGRLLERHDQRLIARAEAWRQHAAAARDFRAASERMTSAADQTADRSRANRYRRPRTLSTCSAGTNLPWTYRIALMRARSNDGERALRQRGVVTPLAKLPFVVSTHLRNRRRYRP